MLSKTHTQTVRFLAILLAATVPLSVVAVASPEELAETKSAFDQLWKSTTETSKRRAALEQNLATFDRRVADAKQDMEKAQTDRSDIRRKIDDQKKLIDVLQEQIDAVTLMRGFYQSVAYSQKDDLTLFVRYLTSRNIALTDSGPAVGGTLLKHLIRGSLGDSIDRELADLALTKTRQRVAANIHVLIDSAEKTENRLQTVMDDMQDQLAGLEGRNKTLTDTMKSAADYIDDSWKERKLNELELKAVASETGEANSRIASMQESLLKIDKEIRDTSVSALGAELTSLQNKLRSLEEKKEEYLRKDAAMQIVEDAALKAFQRTVNERNTDTKLYKRLQERELQLQNLQDAYAFASSDGVIPVDNEARLQTIADLKEQIVLMKSGVPDEAAADYVLKKGQAAIATAARKDYAVQIALITTQMAETRVAITEKEKDIETAKTQSSLAGLPPLFQWPVIGPISASYLDPDYVKVFNVPHRAIDIAVPQNTPIHTVSQGIVFAVKDGGALGYSYILVGHESGYASLYGHISKSFVKPGDRVNYDQIIGLSGGEPGSHGAGPMTTGSHLHLEMMQNGEHFNPAEVLPKR